MDDLRAVFGEALLSYLLAQDINTLTEEQLSGEQRTIVEVLRGWLNLIAGQGPFQQRIGLSDALLAYIPNAGTTFANAAHTSYGGHLPELTETADTVLGLLLIIGRDIYAGFLLPPEREWPPSMMNLTGSVFRHPQIDALCRAIYGDDALKRLFPGEYPGLDLTAEHGLIGVQSELVFSVGHGGSLQLIGLINSLLIAAYYRTLLNAQLDIESYLAMLRALLSDARRLASGRSSNIPVIFGLSNIDLPPGTAVSVPWGTLYSPNQIHPALIPSAANLTAVLVTKRPLKILHISKFDPEAADQHPLASFERHRREMESWTRETEQVASLMRLAFLLASPDEGFFAVRSVSRTVLDPFQQTPMMQWSAQILTPSPMAGLSAEALSRVQQWAQKTRDHPERLGIAMRRMLSAVSDRIDLLDGFIDAVMAWENMFSGRPETNLRVCGAIAWLLEPADYERRSQLFSELKDLYTKRSNLVHGAIETVADPAASRDRAVRIAVESMKRLYADDRLLMIKDSADRGGVILMGAAQEQGQSAEDETEADQVTRD